MVCQCAVANGRRWGRELRRGISLTFDKIQIGYAYSAANAVCEIRQIIQAIFCRRRHHARSTPLANTKPGSPAPAMGPGTEA
jgi:hypothetical protein